MLKEKRHRKKDNQPLEATLFYDIFGADNNYEYITIEGKIYGEEAKKFTMLEYLQKSTGIFDNGGILTKEQVKEMRKRAQAGEKNL